MILQLQIEVIRPEEFRVRLRGGLGAGIILAHQLLRNLSGQTGGEGNKAFMVFLQQFQIHPGLPVKPLHKGLRNHIAQITVAGFVPAQQNQMVGLVIHAVDAVMPASGRHINLAADDRLHARSLGGLVEVDDAIHDAMVRDCDGILAQLLDPLHHILNTAGTVQQAELRVDMEMYKTHNESLSGAILHAAATAGTAP